MSKRFLRWRFM